MALASGSKLGPYEILNPLGAGGMGEVYRARDTRLGRDVAIKILPQYLAEDASRSQRFEQEARVLSALNHPNLLAIYDVGTQDGVHYLVSELLEGETLRQRLSEGTLPQRKAIEYGVQIAKGLAAAHDKGVVHRDLKPENLFLTKDGRVKILDFGLAKMARAAAAGQLGTPTLNSETDPGVVMGTVGYMSPEQVRGKQADHRTDIFAFGAVLYEMLGGKRAFHKPTSAETMTAIMNEDPPALAQSGSNLSPALLRVVQRCLEKNAEQRFQSASDLAFALDALSDSGSAATAASAPAQVRTSWKALTAGGSAIAMIVAVAVWLLRPSANPVVESATQLTNDGEAKPGNMQTDGTRVYFNEGVTGSQRIAQISAQGGETAQVATNLFSPFIAGIKADGSALLVGAGNSILRNPLWLVPLPAGEARRLGDIQANDAGLFPDDRIIYTQGPAVYAAAKDGTGQYKLAEAATPSAVQSRPSAFRPRASPDGKQIVFSVNEAFQWTSIYQANADGTELREILRGGAGNLPPQVCCARWTPDGRYLLFLGEREGRWDLWALPGETHFWQRTAGPVRLSNGPLSYDDVVPGRDGKTMFAIGTQRRGELVRYDSNSRQFIAYLGGISAFAPTFSRDGKWMVYTSYPEHTIWRSRSDGSDRLQLTYPPMEAMFTEISPDGSQVAFNTLAGDTYIVGMNGGTPRKFAENAWGATWSPDSKLLALILPVPATQFGEKGSFEVGIADVSDGKVSVAPGSQGLLGPWFVSQDTVVAANDDANKFVLLNIKTGKVSELTSSEDGYPSWAVSPDFRYLYYSTGGNDPKALRLRFADHAIETITGLKDLRIVNDQYVGVQLMSAPDGSVLTTRDIGTQEIYALSVKWP